MNFSDASIGDRLFLAGTTVLAVDEVEVAGTLHRTRLALESTEFLWEVLGWVVSSLDIVWYNRVFIFGR